MESWLTTQPWIGMILWTLIDISDYWMTIVSARKYRSNAHLEYEGSYELTPQFEQDINALNPISKWHILMLVLTNLVLLILWWLFSLLHFRQGFAFPLGILLLMEVRIHFRHFRTYHLLTQVETQGGLEGRVTYRRWLLYSTSSFEFLSFSVLFLMTAALTWSLFFLGGAFSCLSLALNHHRKHRFLFYQQATELKGQA